MAIWYNYTVVIWYTFSRFGMFYQEKSGNPDQVTKESNVSLMKVNVLGKTGQKFAIPFDNIAGFEPSAFQTSDPNRVHWRRETRQNVHMYVKVSVTR
jgi:hypothetical protein